MQLALVLFALAAIGGVLLAVTRLRGANPPTALALIHGGAAAAGLVLLALPLLNGGLGSGAATVALVLFVVAALGGFALFAAHLRGTLLPIPLMLIHAVVAVAGFGSLLVAVFG